MMKNGDKKLINILKKFPDKNPNPVIRLSDEGILEYYNNPSKGIVEFYCFKLGSKVSDIFFNEVSSIHGTLIDNTGYRNTLRSVGIAYRFPRSPTWTSTVKDS